MSYFTANALCQHYFRSFPDSVRHLSDYKWVTNLPPRAGARAVHEHWFYRGLETSTRIARFVS